MDDDLRRAVLGEADKRSILSDPDKKWPGGVVPFVFSENISKLKIMFLFSVMSHSMPTLTIHPGRP